MSFNEGFTTQGIPFMTGSDGQLLTWSDEEQAWVPGSGLGTVDTTVYTEGSIEGDGSQSDPVRLTTDVNVLGNLTVAGTASIHHLDTFYQQSLVVGDKYITILSGANTHATADGSGILWGSGSNDSTTGEQNSVAHIVYRQTGDKLEIYPNLTVPKEIIAGTGSFTVFNASDVKITGSLKGDVEGTASNADKLDNFDSSEFPRLAISNTFNADQTVTGSLYVSNTVSASLFTGNFTGTGSYSSDADKLDGYDSSEFAKLAESNSFTKNNVFTTLTASVGIKGDLEGTASYALNADKLDGFDSSEFPRLVISNIFNANQTITGSLFVSDTISASAFIGAFNGTASYSNDSDKLDGFDSSDFAKLATDNIFTANQIVSGTLQATQTVTAPSFVGDLTGSVLGTASYAIDADKLDGYHATEIARLASPNVFTIDQTITGSLSVTETVTAKSFVGNLTGSMLGTASYASDSNLLDGFDSSEFPRLVIPNTFVSDQTITGSLYVTDTVSASLFIGTFAGTASYSLDSDKLDGFDSSEFPRLAISNTFNANQIVSGTLDVTQTVTAPTFVGNLTGSVAGTASYAENANLFDSFDSSEFPRLAIPNTFSADQIVTGSLYVTDTVSASVFIGTFNGTASYALNADKLDDYSSSDFAKLTESNSFTENNIFTTATASVGFSGDLLGTSSYALNSDLFDSFDSSEFPRLAISNAFTADQTVTGSLYVTDTVSASFFTGTLAGTASYSLDGDKLDGYHAADFARLTESNSFTENNTFTTVTASVGFSGYVYGTASYAEKANFLDGFDSTDFARVNTDNIFSGSQTVTGSVYVTDTVSASLFIGTLNGKINGTASYSENSDKLDDLDSTDFARVAYANIFTENQTVTGSIYATNNISASYFYGDGSNLIGLDKTTKNVLYVSVNGSDTTGNGSPVSPFRTIQNTLNAASSIYTNFNEAVLIEILPGQYAETDLTINRHNVYLRSSINNNEERATWINGNVIINCTASGAGGKYSDIVAFEGIIFSNGTAKPTVEISGSRAHATHFQNSYLASNNTNSNANALKVHSTRTSANTKVVIRNSIINSQKAGADAIKFEGGDLNLDTVQLYCKSGGVAGTSNGLNITGDSSVLADRLLIELSGTELTGSAVINNSTKSTSLADFLPPYAAFNPTLYLTNTSLTLANVKAVNDASINTTRNIFLWNVLMLGSNKKILGYNPGYPASLAYVTYGDVTSDTSLVTLSNVTPSYLKELHGDVAVNSLSASSGVTGSFAGSFSGTASYALNSERLGGALSSSYVRKDIENIFTANNTFTSGTYFWKDIVIDNPVGTDPNIYFRGGQFAFDAGAGIRISSAGYIRSSGSITLAEGASFNGSGAGITGLTSSNWNNTLAGFQADVRNQLSAGTGIVYNKGTGVISSVAFQGVITGSNLTGSGKDVDNPISLMDDISLNTVTASSGFYGYLYDTASYAENSTRLEDYYSSDFAKIAEDNDFIGNQTITGSVSATDGFIGSFTGSIAGTASYSQNANLLDGKDSTAYAQFASSSNNFLGAVTASNGFKGSISGSVGNFNSITASLKGDGAELFNLTGSNWNPNNSFFDDVVNQISGAYPIYIDRTTGIISYQGQVDFTYTDQTTVTGSGTFSDPLKLISDFPINSITASAGFKGDLTGSATNAITASYALNAKTASYASNAELFDQFDSSAFPRLTINNNFSGNSNTFINVTASAGFKGSISGTVGNFNSVTASLKGDGSQISNLTGSNWGPENSFFNDVMSQLSGSYPIYLDRNTGVIYYQGQTDVITTDKLTITGSATELDPLRLLPDISLTSVTASFSGNLTGSVFGTASYAQNSNLLDGKDSLEFAQLASGSNNFAGNVTASNFVGTFRGNLTGSVTNALTASTLSGYKFSDFAILTASNNVFTNSVTASSFVANNFYGTASYAQNTDLFDDKDSLEFAQLASASNNFLGDVTASNFIGNGANITNISTSNIDNFNNDVGAVFVPGTAIQINPVGDGTYAISASVNISATVSGSDWSGGSPAFYTDVRSAFVAGDGISITSNIDGTYTITSSAGPGGGGGISTVETFGNITGSGVTGNEVRLKDEILLTAVTASSLVSGSASRFDYTDYNTSLSALPAQQVGRVFYDNAGDISDISAWTDITDIAVHLGQQLVIKVKNNGNYSIAKGKVVYISSGVGANPIISTSSYDSEQYSARTLGVTMNAMAPNEFGYVLLRGVLTDIDTSNFLVPGAGLYLGATGSMTTTKPKAPYHDVRIGNVIRANHANEGSIFVSVQNGYELDELHDVQINAAASGDLIVNNGSGLWTNTQTLGGSYTLNGNNTFNGSNEFRNHLTLSNGTKITSDRSVVQDLTVDYAVYAGNIGGSENFARNNEVNTFTGAGANKFQTIISGSENVYFAKNLTVVGTASIGVINTTTYNELQVGDKFIVIMTGSEGHADLQGAGILWGNVDTNSGETTGSNNEHASITYDAFKDALRVYPGLVVSGSGGVEVTGSIRTTGTLTATAFVGPGSSIHEFQSTGSAGAISVGQLVALNTSGLVPAINTDDLRSNMFGVAISVNGNAVAVQMVGEVSVNLDGGAVVSIGTPVYVSSTAGAAIHYAGLSSGQHATQAGYISNATSNPKKMIIQPRVFGVI